MSNVLHEVINSGQPWAAERAQYALQVAEALQTNQISQDEARAILNDLIATEKLEAEGADSKGKEKIPLLKNHRPK